MKFNAGNMIPNRMAEHDDATTNLAGGLAFTTDEESQLYRMVCTSMVQEKRYYQSGQEHYRNDTGIHLLWMLQHLG